MKSQQNAQNFQTKRWDYVDTSPLNRLFASDGKCFDVAIDHGFFNEYAFLSGIESMERAVATIVAANPDAIQLSPGQARLLQRMPGRQKPSLVLRTDVANVYGTKLPRHLFSEMIEQPVEQAPVLGAACVVVNVFLNDDVPAGRRAELEHLRRAVSIGISDDYRQHF